MRKFPYLNRVDRDQGNVAKLQARILEATDQTLKDLISRHGIRRSGADAAALFLKLLPLERSNILLKDLPRKRLKEAIQRIKYNSAIDPAVVESMLRDLRPGIAIAATRESRLGEASFTVMSRPSPSDAEETAVPFVIRALDLAGRFLGTKN